MLLQFFALFFYDFWVSCFIRLGENAFVQWIKQTTKFVADSMHCFWICFWSFPIKTRASKLYLLVERLTRITFARIIWWRSNTKQNLLLYLARFRNFVLQWFLRITWPLQRCILLHCPTSVTFHLIIRYRLNKS